MWVLLSLCGAFFQAFGGALKKKSLQLKGMNNAIGAISFLVAGSIFGALYFLKTGSFWMDNLSVRFWQGMAGYAGLNVVAVWFMYRALDSAEFSYLMPFMTLTSVTMAIPPIFILGEIPSLSSLAGIVLVVAGALYINYQPKSQQGKGAEDEKRRRDNRRGAFYFMATAACYTLTPTAAKVAIQESSALFASFLVHMLIGLGFLGLVFLFGEGKRMTELAMNHRKVLVVIMLAGAITVLENGAINLALAQAPVAQVMALKRLMPFFAFLIGLLYFRERQDIPKKLIATALMVIGAVMVTVFK